MIDSGSDVWWWEKRRNTTCPETAALLRGVRPPRGTTTVPHFHSHLRCNIVRQYTPSSFTLSNNTSPHADMRQAETEMYASSLATTVMCAQTPRRKGKSRGRLVMRGKPQCV
jgi:hypothetical protein